MPIKLTLFISYHWTIGPNTSLQKAGHGVVICTATGQKTCYLTASTIWGPMFGTKAHLSNRKQDISTWLFSPSFQFPENKWNLTLFLHKLYLIGVSFLRWKNTGKATTCILWPTSDDYFYMNLCFVFQDQKYWLYLLVAQMLISFMERNSLVDIMVHKVGMPCFQCI